MPTDAGTKTRVAPGAVAVRRGAEALESFVGVWRVAVFGSVARGSADAASDIDYLVVCDEIDYENRDRLANKMVDAAVAASGCRVDVVLSDTAEWLARTGLASSLEAHLEGEAVDLVRLERPELASRRGQTITMASRAELAVVELRRMERSLESMEKVALQSAYESRMIAEGDQAAVEIRRSNRWMLTLQSADMALEHGLAALGAVTDSPRVGREMFHQLAAFRDVLRDDRVKALVSEILAPLRVSELPLEEPVAGKHMEFTKWRTVVDYGSTTLADEYLSADRVRRYMIASVAMGRLGLAEVSKLAHPAHSREADERFLAWFGQYLDAASMFVERYDAATGVVADDISN